MFHVKRIFNDQLSVIGINMCDPAAFLQAPIGACSLNTIWSIAAGLQLGYDRHG